MKLLVADDDPILRWSLQATLTSLGYEVHTADDGTAAWRILQAADAPPLAILDWMMPGMSGPEVCRQVRALARPEPTYLLLLTSKDQVEDIVSGLKSGANDYITKPFVESELQARIDIGRDCVNLHLRLADRVRQLEAALAQVKRLQELLPICMYCKRIRNDQNYWQHLESYITEHSGAQFSHGICPECYQQKVEPTLRAIDRG